MRYIKKQSDDYKLYAIYANISRATTNEYSSIVCPISTVDITYHILPQKLNMKYIKNIMKL